MHSPPTTQGNRERPLEEIVTAGDYMGSTGVQWIVPRYRVDSKYCVFSYVKQYILGDYKSRYQENQVASVFSDVVIGQLDTMRGTLLALLAKLPSACTRSSAEPGQKELNFDMEKSGSLHSKGKSCFLGQVEEALRRLQNDVELI